LEKKEAGHVPRELKGWDDVTAGGGEEKPAAKEAGDKKRGLLGGLKIYTERETVERGVGGRGRRGVSEK